MEENKFWFRIWSIVALCFVIFVISITTYNINRNNVMASALKDNPTKSGLEIRCAMEGQSSENICALAAMSKK